MPIYVTATVPSPESTKHERIVAELVDQDITPQHFLCKETGANTHYVVPVERITLHWVQPVNLPDDL